MVMMLKGRPKWVQVTPYPCYIAIAFTTADIIRLGSRVPTWFDDHEALGFVEDIDTNRFMVALDINNTLLDYGIIAHEGIHLVNSVMGYAGFPATRTLCADEPDAYLIQWYVSHVQSEFKRRSNGVTLEQHFGDKS